MKIFAKISRNFQRPLRIFYFLIKIFKDLSFFFFFFGQDLQGNSKILTRISSCKYPSTAFDISSHYKYSLPSSQAVNHLVIAFLAQNCMLLGPGGYFSK